MSSHELAQYIDDVSDFPQPGVVFRDISPLLAHHFQDVVNAMAGLYSPEEYEGVDAFVGVDSRGFIFASALATKLGKNFVMPRKAGKLPEPYAMQDYDLEYGTATLHLKHGQGNVIVVDDVAATGGTLYAAADLCVAAGYNVKGFMTLIDLKFLNEFSWNGLNVRSVIQYENA